MEVHNGPAPNTNTCGNVGAGPKKKLYKLYKLYKGAAIWMAGFVYITGIYLEKNQNLISQ